MTRRQPSNYDTLTDLEAHLALAAWLTPRLDDWTGPLRSASTDPGHSAISEANPTEAAAIANARGDGTQPDDWAGSPTQRLAQSATAYVDAIEDIKLRIRELNAKRHTLEPMQLEQAKTRVNERTTPSTVGFCEADDVSCDARDEYHSLIGGLCGACRKAIQRWPNTGDPGGDRRAFIQHRRAEVGRQRKHTA